MLHVFQAGPGVVTCDLSALAACGPYRLKIRHAHGTIVEYFQTAAAALNRQAELEDLVTSAQGFETAIRSKST